MTNGEFKKMFAMGSIWVNKSTGQKVTISAIEKHGCNHDDDHISCYGPVMLKSDKPIEQYDFIIKDRGIVLNVDKLQNDYTKES